MKSIPWLALAGVLLAGMAGWCAGRRGAAWAALEASRDSLDQALRAAMAVETVRARTDRARTDSLAQLAQLAAVRSVQARTARAQAEHLGLLLRARQDSAGRVLLDSAQAAARAAFASDSQRIAALEASVALQVRRLGERDSSITALQSLLGELRRQRERYRVIGRRRCGLGGAIGPSLGTSGWTLGALSIGFACMI